MSFATTARVGQCLGRKNNLGIKRAGYMSIGFGFAVMFFLAIAMLLFPQATIGLYIDIQDPANASIVDLALPMLMVATISQILDAVQKITYGALQGLQDTKTPVLLNIFAFWVVGLTIGYFLGFRFGLGGTGLWLGQSTYYLLPTTYYLLPTKDNLEGTETN